MATRNPKPIPALSEADAVRFWGKVEKRGVDECWGWSAATNPNGYGVFVVAKGKHTLRAPRVAFLLATGENPGDKLVLHKCDNPPCTNIKHLYLGTNGDNGADRKLRNRMPSGTDHYSHLYPERLARGERINTCKLTADQVSEIRLRSLAGEKGASLGREFGVTKSAIYSITSRKNWKAL